jgi:hypothetical protein
MTMDRGHTIYLAGPMDQWTGTGKYDDNDYSIMTRPLAAWRKEVMARAGRHIFLCPESNETQSLGHGQADDWSTPDRDIELIRKCDALVAFVDSSTRIGTFCEIGAAAGLNKFIFIVCAPLGYWDNRYEDLPWFVERLANITYKVPQEKSVKEMNTLSLTQDSDLKQEWYNEAIDLLVELCGGDYINYDNYIQSTTWREKATKAKERVGWRCQVCNRHKDEITLDAHHRTYERLGEELPEDITVLCRDCHSLFEKTKKNKNHEYTNV